MSLTLRRGKNSGLLIVVILFVFSVFVRCVLADFPKKILVYPDELRYFSIAKSLIEGRGMLIQNAPAGYMKILYCLVIAPVFKIFNDPFRQISAISFLNSVIMSSGIFPVYLLGKQLLKKKRDLILSLIVFCVSADLINSMTFMSEVSYMPLGLWGIYVFYKIINEENNIIKYVLSLFGGCLCYILYLNKEIALVFVISYVCYVLYAVYIEKKQKKAQAISCLILLVIFVSLFMIFKLTVFHGGGKSYDQTGLEAILSPYKFGYFLYGWLYCISAIFISYFVVLIIYPVMNLKRLNPDVRNELIFLLLMLFVTAGVIAYTITVREDLGKIVPRVHMRYICFIFLPVTMVFLSGVKSYKRGGAAAVLAAVAACAIFKGIGAGSPVDQLNLNYIIALQNTFPRDWVNNFWHFNWLNLFRVMFVLSVSIAAFLLNRKKLGCFIVSLIVVVSLASNFEGVRSFRSYYSLKKEELADAKQLTQIVPQLPGSVLAVMGDGFDDDDRIIDTYANYPNMYITALSKIGKGRQADSEHLSILSKYQGKEYDGLWNIDFILVPKSLNIHLDEKEFLQLDVWLNGFEIYQNLRPSSLSVPST